MPPIRLLLKAQHPARPRFLLSGLLLAIAFVWIALAPQTQAIAEQRTFLRNERLSLGTEANRSASVRVADLDNDSNLDIVVANGRHWPQQNFVLLNQGRARFSVQRKLGGELRPSYAAEPADIDGDGDLDLVIGNDMAPNQIYLNDGKGRFGAGTTFGEISSVRSITVADIDGDRDVDILVTCRGRQNRIYLNSGDGRFGHGRPFGNERDSTIDVAVTDWNNDGHLDLVLANRDSQKNAILLNDGQTNFKQSIPFGGSNEQTRAVAVADLNGDKHLDIVVGNVGQPNRVYLADGKGGFGASVDFGRQDGRTYSLAVADMNNDKHLDLVVGNAGQANAVYFNHGDGTQYSEVRFGDEAAATYGVEVGDLDKDGYVDIAVANSDTKNFFFLNRPSRSGGRAGNLSSRSSSTSQPAAAPRKQTNRQQATDNGNWPAFRGAGAKGIADGFPVRTEWNATTDDDKSAGVLWSVEVPGLGHSSPVVHGDKLFLATAIAKAGEAPLKVAGGGRPDAADDNGEQSWVILCYDRKTGKELWRQTAHTGRPRATRHSKATHANTSVAIIGDNVVAFFGSEGLHCYDLDGKLKWSRDLGVINISKYGIGWGYASSPAVHGDRIAIVCDDPENPFVAALQLSDGKEVWRTTRKEICVRSWATPFIHSSPTRTQMVVNGWPWIVSYDLASGEELWRIRGGGDNPVPTPFEANGWIYVTNAHGAESPIFVVRPDSKGDITPPTDTGANDSIVWSTRRGGSYMSTPVVYGDYLYLGNTNGIIRCFHARTGEKVYEERLGSGAAITASLVAADGKIYCPSENGTVYVLAQGPEFKVLAKNEMGEPCLATPAVARGVLYLRTTKRLIAIQ